MSVRVQLQFKVESSDVLRTVLLELYPERAPRTVESFLSYVGNQAYVGSIVHDIQAGKLVGMGLLESDLMHIPRQGLLVLEADNGLRHEKGSLAAIPGTTPTNGPPGFFVNLQENPEFNHTAKTDMKSWGAAVFGTVLEGFDFLLEVSQLAPMRRGLYAHLPVEVVELVSAQIVSD